MLEAPAIVLKHYSVIAHQFMHTQQQFSKIHHAAALAGRLIVLIQPDQLSTIVVTLILHVLRAQSGVLLCIDKPDDFFGHPASFIQILRFENFLDGALLIVCINDLE